MNNLNPGQLDSKIKCTITVPDNINIESIDNIVYKLIYAYVSSDIRRFLAKNSTMYCINNYIHDFHEKYVIHIGCFKNEYFSGLEITKPTGDNNKKKTYDEFYDGKCYLIKNSVSFKWNSESYTLK